MDLAGYRPSSAFARRYRPDPWGNPNLKRPWWLQPYAKTVLRAEYERILPQAIAAHAAASPAMKARIEAADDAFHNFENPLPYIRWARTVVPGAFPPDMREQARAESLRQQARIAAQAEVGFTNASPTALEPPPDGLLYHGSKNAPKVRVEGLHAVEAENVCGCDPEYGWEACWRRETFDSYQRLSREQRARFHQMIGVKGRLTGGWRLARHVALFWVSKRIETARSCGRSSGTFLIDQSKIRYYWWFPDYILGEQSYVFVCPNDDVPTVPPSGLVLLP